MDFGCHRVVKKGGDKQVQSLSSKKKIEKKKVQSLNNVS
jgi:hypothetical protein